MIFIKKVAKILHSHDYYQHFDRFLFFSRVIHSKNNNFAALNSGIMNIRIGDIVRFISEKLEGKVTGIIDNKTVNVFCDEYGFEIPAAMSDLVVIRSDFKTETSTTASNNTASTQKNVSMQSADTLYLAFVPSNFNNLPDSHFELHLVNDTREICLYSVTFFDGERYTGISAGNCNPDSASLIGNYSLKEIDKIKSIHVQAIFYQKGNRTLRPTIDTKVKVTPASLCKSGAYHHTRWFQAISFTRALDKENIEKEEEIEINPQQLLQAKKEKHDQSRKEERATSQTVNNNILEVDLHINSLLETTAGMENKDMLEYQLDVFHKTLEKYKLRRGQKIVFIHGKGDGVLRQRILWELQTKYKRFQHQDASFKQYGYGATMVIIK